MYRVVPDVQALVQAALSRRGAAGQLITSWERGEITLVTCEEIIVDYEAVLRRPHILRKYAHISDETIASSIDALRTKAACVTLVDVPRVVPDDPDDDIVLACALAGNADYIVSRDRHLLRVTVYQGIPILSAEAFAAILRGQVSEPLILAYGRRS